MKPTDLSGQKIGKLEILLKVGVFPTGKTNKMMSHYACKCECGAIVTKNSKQLYISKNKSCRNCKMPKGYFKNESR